MILNYSDAEHEPRTHEDQRAEILAEAAVLDGLWDDLISDPSLLAAEREGARRYLTSEYSIARNRALLMANNDSGENFTSEISLADMPVSADHVINETEQQYRDTAHLIGSILGLAQ